MTKKKLFLLLCSVVALCLGLLSAGCGDDRVEKKVALAMANSSLSWQRNGSSMQEQLVKEGFTVDLRFADTSEQQVQQLSEMIDSSPDCIVIGAVDSEKLVNVLSEAKEKGIPVIAYDRLIMNSDAVSYYATYDNWAIGEGMGEYIEHRMNLKQGAGPFYIELFAGAPTDNNSYFFFNGAMAVLKPYIDNGQLIVPSGQTEFEQVQTMDWDAANAQERMEKLLQGPDAGVKLDIILSPNDNLAVGIRKALKDNGYTQMPLITGLDADEAAVEAIKNGEQAITIFKDPTILAAKTIRMIRAVVEGTKPDINNMTDYDNGIKKVPAYLCTPVVVDLDNIEVIK